MGDVEPEMTAGPVLWRLPDSRPRAATTDFGRRWPLNASKDGRDSLRPKKHPRWVSRATQPHCLPGKTLRSSTGTVRWKPSSAPRQGRKLRRLSISLPGTQLER